MKTLVRMQFGSHLYGTATPASDMDIKAVHLPAASDILLLRAKPVYSQKTKADMLAKNTAEDTDFESYSLQKYLALVAEGQTVALDMLFAPAWAFQGEPDALWRDIMDNRHRLLSRKYASFVGYCRQQANKYGIKGSRVAAARQALELLSDALADKGAHAKLGDHAEAVEALAASHEHMAIADHTMVSGGIVRHWDVCGRKMPYTSSVKTAHEIMARLVAEYGKRALQPESNQGVDWKALSHAVRIGRQAIELLQTGNVIFPRPDAADLVAIKTGQREYTPVAEDIENLLTQIEATSAASSLPDAPDYEWIDGFVSSAHRGVIMAAE